MKYLKQEQDENMKKAPKLNLDAINWFLNISEQTPIDLAVLFDRLHHCVSMVNTVDDDMLQKYIPDGMELKDDMLIYTLKALRDLFMKTAIDNGQSLSDASYLEFYFGNHDVGEYSWLNNKSTL
ncbi:MAG: hypothetical protein FWF09_00160 [Bacteroidales bacterium]|nr:hypothetical protein [Bacteroidales bacterium]